MHNSYQRSCYQFLLAFSTKLIKKYAKLTNTNNMYKTNKSIKFVDNIKKNNLKTHKNKLHQKLID